MADSTLPDLQQLTFTLFEIGAIQFGKIKLHSGKKSHIYLDFRLLVSYPQALRLVAGYYRQLLENLRFDLLAATPMAGLPIGTALCLDMDIPLIFPRKTAKSYGTGKGIEGKFKVGQRAVVIDDLITTGDSILGTIAFLKAAGLQVKDAVVLVDRQEGGVEALQTEGYRLHALLKIDTMLSILLDDGRITDKQYSKALKSLKK